MIKKFFRDIYFDLLIYGLFLNYTLKHFDKGERLEIIGLCLSLFFVVLWIIARINLGAAFTVLPEARKLKTHGLYSKFRHPIYLFSGLSYLSLLLILDSSYLYLIGLLLFAVQIYRTQLEGRKLRKIFGAEYDEYYRKTLF